MKQEFLAILTMVWFLASGAAAPVRMTPVKIADGVYMFQHSQGSGNSTVVITDDGVLVFDFHIDNADQTMAGIRKLTDKQVKYLISSHSAGDHAPAPGTSARTSPFTSPRRTRSTIFRCRSWKSSTSGKIPTIHGTPDIREENWFVPISASTAR